MNLNNMDEGISEAFKGIKTLEKNSKEYSDTNILSFSLSFNINRDVSRYQYFKLPEIIDYSKYVALGTFLRNGITHIMELDIGYAFDNAQWDTLSLKINTTDKKIEVYATDSISGKFNLLLIPVAATTVLEKITD